MSIEDMPVPQGSSLNVKAATAITMVCLATAIIVLAIDWQIKRDVIKAANDARATLDQWKALYEHYPAPGPARSTRKPGTVRRGNPSHVSSDVLPGTSGVEAGSADNGSSAPRGKSSGGSSANGTAGNRSGGVPDSGKQVGA